VRSRAAPSKNAIYCVAEFFEGKFRSAKIKNKNRPSIKGRHRAKYMNNPNPFLPKGSLLEQQSLRRSRLKIGVSCVLAVSVIGLVGMLIQGCKRENHDADLNPPPTVDTNSFAVDNTNPPPVVDTNAPVVLPPISTNPPVMPPPAAAPTAVETPAATGSDYTVAKGDSLAKIAKKNGVTLKALEAANPGVVPTKLKVGQKLTLPAGGKLSADATSPTMSADETGTSSYTVKSGDTLHKIAKAHGTTVKAIEAANGLSTTKIKVGQKLKSPSKAEAAAPAAAPVDTTPAPPVPTMTPAPMTPPPAAPGK
jgi:LysM repeat protein